ncbi:BON domain-containing protein [Luteimonas wenzhouensis]|jgi:hyperosmotically inducible protein|nr:BON domain-containing protein [Luteimonas wenzhouensis]
MKQSRIPLAVAMTAALAFAAGCADRADPAVDDRADAAMTEPADQAATPPVGPTDAQADPTYADANPDMGAPDRLGDSDQPVDDTWITTKVKSSLLADSDVSGLSIDVETVNGTVTLSGEVDSQAQIDEATRIAREIEGVVNVDSSRLTVKAD